ncbi:hypothetical protein Dimus_011649 [Dionaea muscipula]
MAISQKFIYPTSLCISISLIFLLPTSSSSAAASDPVHLSDPADEIPDVHDILTAFGLPKGILPDAVKSYNLSGNGEFTVELERTCYVQFEDQLVYYDKLIKGKLSRGSVSGVIGIQAKEFFIWVSVTGMEVDLDSDTVEFHVGALSKNLPAKLFEKVHHCLKKGSTDDSDAQNQGRRAHVLNDDI